MYLPTSGKITAFITASTMASACNAHKLESKLGLLRVDFYSLSKSTLVFLMVSHLMHTVFLRSLSQKPLREIRPRTEPEILDKHIYISIPFNISNMQCRSIQIRKMVYYIRTSPEHAQVHMVVCRRRPSPLASGASAEQEASWLFGTTLGAVPIAVGASARS